MRPLNKIILFVLIAVLFAACKKEDLPTNSAVGQPVFSFNGTIGGSSINLKAGVNNYYMYSSFAQDTVGHDTVVYGFIGNLQSTSNNKNSIQITINDYKVSIMNASVSNHIDSVFSQPVYVYNNREGDTLGYSVKFTPIIYYGSVSAFTYFFGDHSSNIITTYTTPVSHTYTTTAIYTTSVTAQFSVNGNVTMTDTIKIQGTPQLWIDSIHSGFGHDSVHNNVSLKAFIQNGTPPYTYFWSFGDGKTSLTSSGYDTITVSHTYDTTGVYVFPVYLQVTDHFGSSASYVENVTDTVPVSNSNRFDYTVSPPVPVITTSYPLSQITIAYTDPSGNVYTSKNPLQPASSTFQVLSVADYKNNMNNESTKELTVKFTCILYNTITGTPVSATGTAVIAVAYQ